jgi:putative membrane protein
MMNDGYGWSMGWGFPFMGLFFIAFFIIGIVAVIKLIFSNNDKPVNTHSQTKKIDTPIDILKQRYAKGEIDQPTFEQMKRDLT